MGFGSQNANSAKALARGAIVIICGYYAHASADARAVHAQFTRWSIQWHALVGQLCPVKDVVIGWPFAKSWHRKVHWSTQRKIYPGVIF